MFMFTPEYTKNCKCPVIAFMLVVKIPLRHLHTISNHSAKYEQPVYKKAEEIVTGHKTAFNCIWQQYFDSDTIATFWDIWCD